MIIKANDISLSSLRIEDIELVRSWRNHIDVRTKMIFQTEISRDMQADWYSNLSELDIYLLIESANNKIGLINVKNIDFKKRSGEAGIFIGSDEYRSTSLPVFATLLMMSTFFDDFGFNSLKAKVLKENQDAIDFNLMLGYEAIGSGRSGQNEYLELQVNKEDFANITTQLKSTLDRIRKERRLFLTDQEKALLLP